MNLFQPGQPKQGGRARGVKNRLSYAFMTALVEDFEQHGADAIKICRVERPNEYLRVIAHLMPKELDITTSHIQEISDDDLTGYIEYIRLQLAGRLDRVEGREGETIDGELPRLLSSIREAT